VSEVHRNYRHALALRELRSRAHVQRCWSCGRELLAAARKPDPAAITVGHYVDVDLNLTDPYDPRNYGPQCAPCNHAGGAHRTNQKRAGVTGAELTISPPWS
jgi:nitrate reductase cytochrome c-type subunit